MHVRVIVVVFVALFAGPVAADPGAADNTPPTPDARTLFERASAAFARGEYGAAAIDFRAAYALDPRPLLLLNAGQAYRLASPPDCAAAQRAYELYLQAEVNAPERPEVERHIRAMKACTAAAADMARPVPSHPVGPPDAPAVPSSHARQWSAPLWLAGAGIGAAGAGTTLYLLARHRYQALEPTCPCTDDQIGSWEALTRVGYGLWIAGGVATAAALWWWSTPGRDEKAVTHAPRLLAWVGGGGGGVVVQGSWR